MFLKEGVHGFSYFQLFYFLTRIIPDSAHHNYDYNLFLNIYYSFQMQRVWLPPMKLNSYVRKCMLL